MPPLLVWLIQLMVILVAARVVGWLFQLIRQPRVVGEMAAGILLGPSLLGWLAPGFAQGVLGVELLGGLNLLSQLGLLLFMFLVGLEIQPDQLRKKGQAALAISFSSIVVPFTLGCALAVALYPQLAEARVPLLHFALFIGTALSITAFPVLARILSERRMLQTSVGALAIACAAVDDITAWCLLAGVVLLVNTAAAGLPVWLMLTGSLGYVAAMLFGGRWLASRLLATARAGALNQGHLAGILLTVIGSAAFTEWLGIHALFGAFLAGAIMPKDHAFIAQVRAKLEDLTVVFLLPLFFASIGLRTDIGLFGGGLIWLYGGLLLGVAVVGKLGSAALAARISGLGWRDSLAIGALMNTRGLMELVVASVGLEIGVITPTVFSLLVIMALATTCMTAPLLDLFKITPQPRTALEREADLAGDTA